MFPLAIAILAWGTDSPFPSSTQALEGWIALHDQTLKDWAKGSDWKLGKDGSLISGKQTLTHLALVGQGDWRLECDRFPDITNQHLVVGIQRGIEHEALFQGPGVETTNGRLLIQCRSTGKKTGVLSLTGSGMAIHKIWFRPKIDKELISGTGLAQWVLLPGKKSRVETTPEGWIRIQDGPGDLQSRDTFGNFMAQLTIRTGGKHFNSGLFFRAIPGEQWQGYEAQIRNEFTPGNERPYTLESFDPNTHLPLGKSLIHSTAVDYGTGAIYRRLPARSQAANDGEWFVLTVVAVDRCICTWVQGQPQANWTDNRPANTNARQGYRSKPGVFGIQGHDPTTLLDLKSLKVAPLDNN